MLPEAIRERRGIALAALLAAVGITVLVITNNYTVFAAPLVIAYLILLYRNWKIAYWVLLFAVPLSVQFSIVENSLSLSLPDEPMMWVFLLLFFFLFAYRPNAIPHWWVVNIITVIILFQFIWLCVAVIYSEVFLFSLKFLIAKVWFLVCFYIYPLWIFKEKKDFKTGFIVMFAAVAVSVVVSVVRHAQVHFSFLLVNRAVGLLYYNHVEYSTVLSMFLPLICAAYFLTRGMKKYIRVLLLLTIVFFVGAIFLSYARAALIAVVFSAIVAAAIHFRLVNFIMPAIYSLIILLLVYMVRDNKYIDYRPNYEHTYMHKSFSGHIIATFQGRDMSSMERLYRWIAAIRMSADRPWTGVGPHGFYYYYKPYTVSKFKTYVSKNDEHSTTHNYFLFMLVEQGWPAMLLYAILLIAVFALAQRTYHQLSDRFYKYCTLGLAGMFAAGFVNNFFSDMVETHKVGALYYLSIALLVVLYRKSVLDIKLL